eukprot:1148064-Pelagomonas_calceolata.AAC.4
MQAWNQMQKFVHCDPGTKASCLCSLTHLKLEVKGILQFPYLRLKQALGASTNPPQLHGVRKMEL